MDELIDKLKSEITELADDAGFVHHEWFIKQHILVVEKIALELCGLYSDADKDLVVVFVWMHDYAKIVDFDNEFEATEDEGDMFMSELGFDDDVIERTMAVVYNNQNIEDVEADDLPIEDKILISADGCSHFLYGNYEIFWRDNPDMSIEALTQKSIINATTDYNLRLVLPETQDAFEQRFKYHLERNGLLPEKFFS